MSLTAAEALDIATSAGGAMQSVPHTTNIVSVSAEFAKPATVSSYDSDMIWPQTLANPWPPIIVRSKAESVQHGASVAELRRLSGLTWDQLAGLMDVSRRSLHHWVSGKPASAEHQTRLQRLLGTLRRLDRGDSTQNRTLLLTPDHTGRLLLDLLKSEKYEAAVALAGQQAARHVSASTELSAAARASRTPPAPADLVQAKQDRPRSSHRAVIKKPLRHPKPQG